MLLRVGVLLSLVTTALGESPLPTDAHGSFAAPHRPLAAPPRVALSTA